MTGYPTLWRYHVLPSSANLFVSILIYLFSCAHIFSQKRDVKPLLDPYLCLSQRVWQACNVLKFYLIKKMNFSPGLFAPLEIGCNKFTLIAVMCCYVKLIIRKERVGLQFCGLSKHSIKNKR